MTPHALLDWTRATWQVAGPAAPLLMRRYGQLTLLNRTSRTRVIKHVPQRTGAQTVAVPPPPAGDVVIPVYNNFDDTAALLAALHADTSFSGDIIIVHDASTDERLAPLLKAAAARDARVRLLENERNRGFVQTCNRGLAASARDVVILNTDIGLPRGAVARLLRRLRSDPTISTVTPFSNAAYCVGLPDLVYTNAPPFGCTVDQIDAALQALPAVKEIELPCGVGFCMAMSRASIDALGAFDESFGLGYGEETDFCLRAARRGLKHVLASDTYVAHKGGQSFGGSWQLRGRRGLLKVLHRHPGYVDRVARYLDAGESRAVAFAALLKLSAATPANPVSCETSSDGRQAVIAHGDSRYAFRFKDAQALQAARALAG